MPHGRRIVAVFAITQTIGYGTLYYSFAVLLHPIARDLHTSATTVTGALTTAVLTSAIMAVPVGHWLEALRRLRRPGRRHGDGSLRTGHRGHRQLVRRRRPRAVLAMIVVVGFASTIFMPLTGILTDRYGWRTTLLPFATLYAAIAVPLHAFVIRRPPDARSQVHRGRQPVGGRRSATAGSGSWPSLLSPTAPP
jgi:predicted MFS family arabinose efflux permease